jgi:hypothetical protein
MAKRIHKRELTVMHGASFSHFFCNVFDKRLWTISTPAVADPLKIENSISLAGSSFAKYSYNNGSRKWIIDKMANKEINSFLPRLSILSLCFPIEQFHLSALNWSWQAHADSLAASMRLVPIPASRRHNRRCFPRKLKYLQGPSFALLTGTRRFEPMFSFWRKYKPFRAVSLKISTKGNGLQHDRR